MKRLLIVAIAVLGLAFQTTGAQAQATKMTIATGVDPGFGAYYVAKTAGIFEKNGLDVQLNTGPSGSAMVAFVIQNQVQSAYGAEQAGIQNFNIDNNVVVVAEGALMHQWYGMVARNVDTMDALKGKKIGVARGSGSEVFWLAMVEKLNLKPSDYTIIQVEAPEMVAALERGNIDAFTSWEPWITRAISAVSNAKLLRGSEGIMSPRIYIYMNKGWVEKNPGPAQAFMRSMSEATDLIRADPAAAATHISTFLKLDKTLTSTLMTKLRYDLRLDQGSIENFVVIEQQLKALGKLAKPIDYPKFIYPDLLKQLHPEKVTYNLPK
jgi:ABC-type nitrate/sulfonate/bicarbonate transport system substrate-binding protein